MPSESEESPPSAVCWRLAAIILAVLAALCLGAGIVLPFVTGGVFSRKLAETLPIASSSVSYSGWVSSELRFQVWMWNLTNAKAVLNSGSVPNLSQVGPFTFRETRTREGVQFYSNNTVGYDDVRAYYFLPEESVGNMSDYHITNVNLPYIGVALRTREKSVNIRKILQRLLSGPKGGIFTTRTVEELLLGYQDVSMRGLSSMARMMSFGTKLPSRFGIMLGKNSTAKGSALVGTGKGNLRELNRIHLWNGRPSLNLWRRDWANQVVGTDGTMFPPPVSPKEPLVVFTPDLCRSANMTYRHTDTVQGITVLAFSPAKSALMNASGNPHNAAFCTPRCLDSGVLNLSLCLPGAPPIVASAPHFHGAPTYARAVSGINPLAEGGRGFETRLEVEPNTGLLLRAARRMQINIALEYVEGFPDTERFGELFLMPYLWLNESGAIGPLPAAKFKQRVLWPLRLASLISWILVALGIALAVVGGVVCCLDLRLRSASHRPLGPRRGPQPGGKAGVRDGATKAEKAPPLKQEANWQQQGEPNQAERQQSEADELLKSLPESDIV